jgi:hypothetical protein
MKYKYTYNKQDYELPTGEDYERLNCGCYRQPVNRSKKHLATCVCKKHGQTMLTAIIRVTLCKFKHVTEDITDWNGNK